MPPNQVAGLRKRALNGSIDQYTGCPEGSYEKKIFIFGELLALKKCDQPDTKKGPNKRPEMFPGIHQGLFINNVF